MIRPDAQIVTILRGPVIRVDGAVAGGSGFTEAVPGRTIVVGTSARKSRHVRPG